MERLVQIKEDLEVSTDLAIYILEIEKKIKKLRKIDENLMLKKIQESNNIIIDIFTPSGDFKICRYKLRVVKLLVNEKIKYAILNK